MPLSVLSLKYFNKYFVWKGKHWRVMRCNNLAKIHHSNQNNQCWSSGKINLEYALSFDQTCELHGFVGESWDPMCQQDLNRF